MLRRRVGGLDDRRVLSSAARTLLASGIMAAALGAYLALLPGLPRLFLAGGGMALGTAVFWVAALALRVEEAAILPRTVWQRLRR